MEVDQRLIITKYDDSNSVTDTKFSHVNPFVRLIPFQQEVEDDSIQLLQIILDNLGQSIAENDCPSIKKWLVSLEGYLETYGLKLTKHQHVKIIEMLVELFTETGTPEYLIPVILGILVSLMRKPWTLKPGQDLVLDWHKLYDWGKLKFDNNPTDSIVFLQRKPRCFQLFKKFCQYGSAYFVPGSQKQIFDEVKPSLYPHDVSMSMFAVETLVLLLPMTEPNFVDEILTPLMKYWKSTDRYPWDIEMFDFIGRASMLNIGRIDWSDHAPFIYSRILKGFRLPLSYIEWEKPCYMNQASIKSISMWVINSLHNVKYNYLEQLMIKLDTYFRPSNKGEWTLPLKVFITRLTDAFVKRVQKESNNRDTWERQVPDEFKLTVAQQNAFALTVKDAVLNNLASHPECRWSQTSLYHIASLNTPQIVPSLIEDFEKIVNERTSNKELMVRLVHLKIVSRFIARDFKADIVNILRLVAEVGIDPNDAKKTSSAIMFFKTISQFMSFHITPENGMADFLEIFFEKYFTFIKTRGDEYESLPKHCVVFMIIILPTMCHSGIEIGLQHLKSLVLDDSYREASAMISVVASTFTITHPKQTMKALLPSLYQILEALLSIQDDNEKKEILYYLQSFNAVVNCQTFDFKIYFDKIENILASTLGSRDREIMKKGAELLSNVLNSLSKAHAVCAPASYSTDQDWGKAFDISDFKVSWCMPDEDNLDHVNRLFNMFLWDRLDKLEQLVEKEDATIDSETKTYIESSLCIIGACLSCYNFLPHWTNTNGAEGPFYVQSTMTKLEVASPRQNNALGHIATVMTSLQPKLSVWLEDDVNCLSKLSEILSTLLDYRPDYYAPTVRVVITFSDSGPFPCSTVTKTLEIYMLSELDKKFVSLLRDNDLPYLTDCLTPKKTYTREIVDTKLKETLNNRYTINLIPPTPLDLSLVNSLFQLSTSRYDKISHPAKEGFTSYLMKNMELTKVVVPRVLDLIKEQENEHLELVGLQYLIGMVFISHFSSLVRAELLPEIINIEIRNQKISSIIGRNLYKFISGSSTSNRITNFQPSAKAMEIVNQLTTNKFQPKKTSGVTQDLELLDSLVQLVQENEISYHPRLRLLHLILAMGHPDIKFSSNVNSFILKSLTHEALQVREVALEAATLILLQNKRKINYSIVRPDEQRAVDQQRNEHEGRRQSTAHLIYDDDWFPTNEKEWRAKCRIKGNYVGYYSWPSSYEQFPSEPYEEDSLFKYVTEEELIFKKYLLNQQVIDELMKFAKQKEEHKFSQNTFLFLKYCIRNLGIEFYRLLRPHISDSLKKFADKKGPDYLAEMLCACMCGSEHWPFAMLEEMWSTLELTMESTINCLNKESVHIIKPCITRVMKHLSPYSIPWVFRIIKKEILPALSTKNYSDNWKIDVLPQIFKFGGWKLEDLCTKSYNLVMNNIDILDDVHRNSYGLIINFHVEGNPEVRSLDVVTKLVLDHSNPPPRANMRAACYVVQGCYDIPAIPNNYFKLLPFIFATEQVIDDDELKFISSQALMILSSVQVDVPKVSLILNTLHETFRSSSRTAKVSYLKFLEVVVLYNSSSFIFDHNLVTLTDDIVMTLLSCQYHEVQKKACSILSGLIHGRLYHDINDLYLNFVQRSNTSEKGSSTRVAAVLGICAYIQAHPYSTDTVVCQALLQLSKFKHDPEPLPSTIRYTIDEFKRTHADMPLELRQQLHESSEVPSYFV